MEIGDVAGADNADRLHRCHTNRSFRRSSIRQAATIAGSIAGSGTSLTPLVGCSILSSTSSTPGNERGQHRQSNPDPARVVRLHVPSQRRADSPPRSGVAQRCVAPGRVEGFGAIVVDDTAERLAEPVISAFSDRFALGIT